MRKETVDVEFLVTSRNGSRKVLHVYLELEYTGIFLKNIQVYLEYHRYICNCTCWSFFVKFDHCYIEEKTYCSIWIECYWTSSFFQEYFFLVLTKTRINLKWPETTYNEQEKTWNDLQWARNDLKQPTMSKTQPTMTWTYLQWAKKRHKMINKKQIFRLFYNMGQTFIFSNMFSTQHLVALIWGLLHRESQWKQSIKHPLSCIKRQLSCVFFYRI